MVTNVSIDLFLWVFFIIGLFLVTGGIIILVLWNRRKLTFTNFLNEFGKWEKKSWKKIPKQQFTYEGCMYNFSVADCTHDNINRNIAHYIKGDPRQLQFPKGKNYKIEIGTSQFSATDFLELLWSKVLVDIFHSDEVFNLLIIILVAVILAALINIGVTAFHNPEVACHLTNQTLSQIQICRNIPIIPVTK